MIEHTGFSHGHDDARRSRLAYSSIHIHARKLTPDIGIHRGCRGYDTEVTRKRIRWKKRKKGRE